jgi:hypothetical protein
LWLSWWTTWRMSVAATAPRVFMITYDDAM